MYKRQEYGYDFGTKGSRIGELGEALPRIASRFEKLNPQPTRHIPVLIGGSGEKKTLPLVAKYADAWHGFNDVETYRHKTKVLSGYCEEIGRDPETIERSAGIPFTGDVEELVRTADAISAEGVSLITVGTTGPDYDLTAVEALCRWRG